MEAELDKGAWDMPTKNGVAVSIMYLGLPHPVQTPSLARAGSEE